MFITVKEVFEFVSFFSRTTKLDAIRLQSSYLIDQLIRLLLRCDSDVLSVGFLKPCGF